MALRSAPLLLLVLVTVTVRESCMGASSHSLKYLYTAISEPSEGQPHFVSLGLVDGQVFVRYDSNSRKGQPQVSWMEKVGKEDPQYWKRETGNFHGWEMLFRKGLETLRSRYNQSEGLHTLQLMYGCELHVEGGKRGFNLYGYEGRTFITFDTETLTWVALNPMAQITQRKWDAIPGLNQKKKVYLEENCIEWLEKYLFYQKEALLRTEPPVVTMSSRTEVEDGMETHVCRVDGFYPREIDASWTRDGEVWLEETFHGSVAPNADGTYHYWLSIRIEPKERGRYRCHVEHDSLQDPLDLELKEPTNSKHKLLLLLIILLCAVVSGLVLLNARLIFLYKRRQNGDKATPDIDGGSERSDCQLLQGMYGCDLYKDRSKEGFHQFRYDGKNFITFDTETCTWVALKPLVKITQRKWDVDPGMNQGKKAYLEKICIECLETYLSYGKEMLLRTETPKVTVRTRMEVEDGMGTHIDRLAGFYPSWEKDENVWLQNILNKSAAPIVFETYPYCLSIRIDPKERGRYWCHVEHDGLPEHLDVSLKKEKDIDGGSERSERIQIN